MFGARSGDRFISVTRYFWHCVAAAAVCLATGHNFLTLAAGTVTLSSRVCGGPILCATVPEVRRDVWPRNIVGLTTISKVDHTAVSIGWGIRSPSKHQQSAAATFASAPSASSA